MNNPDHTAAHLCDPALHDGERIPSDYFVWAANLTGNRDGHTVRMDSSFNARMYACCQEHLPQALAHVLGMGGGTLRAVISVCTENR